MKRLLALILTALIVLSLTACGGSTSTVSGGDKPQETAQTSKPEETKAPTPAKKETAHEITYTNFHLYTNSIGTVWGQTIVEVTNTGDTNLYLGSASYDVEDAAGKLAASESSVSVFPSVIAPGEKAYLYDETIFDDLDVQAEYKILPHIKASEAKVDYIRFDISDFELKEGSLGLGIKGVGRVCNNTEKDEDSMIYIAATLFDANNACIGLMFTILTDDLPAGEKIGFEMSAMSLPDSVTLDSIASFDVVAYPLQMQF